MWRTSTRVLRSTACILAVLCFVFIRVTAIAIEGGESGVNACTEICHVCATGYSPILLEGKPHKDSRDSAAVGDRFAFHYLNETVCQPRHLSYVSKTFSVSDKQPLWLLNRALLI